MGQERKLIPYPTIVGAVLAEARENEGMSQKQAAEAIGISQSSLARMELGRACTLENLLKVARACDVPLSAIFDVCDKRESLFKSAGFEVSDEIPKEVAWMPGDHKALLVAVTSGGGIGATHITASIPLFGGIVSSALTLSAVALKKKPKLDER